MSVVTDFLNKTFHDEIVDVKPPREWWEDYHDVGPRQEGYIVRVVYKYKGMKDIKFSIDNEHLKLVSAIRAARRARRFYADACKKIKQRNENTK